MNIQKLFDEVKRTAIITNYAPAEEEMPTGKSKFGGKPHLPNGFEWPCYEGADFEDIVKNRPLSFLAQINLEEVAEFDKDDQLPHRGMLYFFYELCTMRWGFDPKDRGCARVFYVEDMSELQAIDLPEEMEEYCRVPEFKLSFASQINLPDYEEIAEYVTDLDWDVYDEEKVLYGYEEDDHEDVSKLLGYADVIQNAMPLECEEASNGIYCGNIPDITDEQKKEMLENSKDWVLLFQMSTVENDEYELMFGDCGSIYYYIRKQDLKERNFDHVWLVLQCF